MRPSGTSHINVSGPGSNRSGPVFFRIKCPFRMRPVAEVERPFVDVEVDVLHQHAVVSFASRLLATMPPSGSGQPVSCSQRVPRSSTRPSPRSGHVNRPSWMHTPKTALPACSLGMISEKTCSTGVVFGWKRAKSSAAVVSLPGQSDNWPAFSGLLPGEPAGLTYPP